jgi:alkylation response protein AidB-like acyl-CoA dehydrogenase
MTVTQTRTPCPVLFSESEIIAAASAVADRLRQGASDTDRAGVVPFDALEEVRLSGLLTINIPRWAGGAESSNRIVAEVLRLLATGDPAVALLTSVHYNIVFALRERGSQDIQARLFAEVLVGARFGNAASEREPPPAGHPMNTRISIGADGVWRIRGRKYYATGANGADWVAIATEDPEGRIVMTLVRGASDGLTVLSDWDSIGMRATQSGSVIIEGAIVDPANTIEFWRTFEEPGLWLVRDGVLHNAIDIGAARTALADTVEYVRETAKPARAAAIAGVTRAADDPHLVGRVGQLTARLRAAELLLDDAARAVDVLAASDPLTADEVAAAAAAVDAAKALGGEIAAEIGHEVIGIGGTRAADDRLNLHRHWRNIRTHTVHDPGRWRYHALGNFVLSGPGLPPSDLAIPAADPSTGS